MITRELGSQGLRVGAVGLGCLSLTGHHSPWAGEEAAIATVNRALDLGVTMFDTADVYGNHRNERFVGSLLKPVRDQVTIATKFGIVKNTGPIPNRIRGDAEFVRQACDASLDALGVDVIDLYYCHRPDPKVPIEETVGAMAELVRVGKVRYLGLSEPSPRTLRRAHAVHPISAIQSEWSLWSRDIETGVLPVARELGIGIVPSRPLGTGFLTGRLKSLESLDEKDDRRKAPRFQPEAFQRNLELLRALEEMAQRIGCSTAQLSVAWLVSQGPDVVPIPGADRPEYIEDNVEALKIDLSRDDLAQLDALFPVGAASGERYSDMSWVGIDTPTA